jgi:phage N-6-adenine-methyltransferase
MSVSQLQSVTAEIAQLHAEILGVARTSIEKAIRVGELLHICRRKIADGDWLLWLEMNVPFSQKTAWRYMWCFEHREEIESQLVTLTSMSAVFQLLSDGKHDSGGAHVSNNSGDSEWFTPTEYVEAARKVMGQINLDPASTETANSIVKAEQFYCAKDDGLKQRWHGCIWLNPPYSQPAIEQFCTKVVEEFSAGRIEAACVLINNATETKFFQSLARISTAICFPAGRIRFWHPEKESATPLQGQAVLYLGNSPKLFIQAFKPFGFVVT